MSKLIYIIDDDLSVLHTTSKLIEESSSSTETKRFRHGLEALNRIRKSLAKSERLPDVIFLDSDMPIFDVWQFLDAFNLLEIENPIKIYILTSSVDSADIERERTSMPPLSGCIIKPITKQKLSEILVSL